MPISLYDRLNGYEGIHAFATRLINRAHSDTLLGRFWSHRGADRNARELQLLIDYLVRETGGRMYYSGLFAIGWIIMSEPLHAGA